MKILALDLGSKTIVACVYKSETAKHKFCKISCTPQNLHDLIVDKSPDKIVLEIGPQAGWVYDLATSLGIEASVANVNHEGWRWRKVKRKTDRLDALKLAQLCAMNQLPTIYMPERKIRQWRALIQHRHTLISHRVGVKNQIHAILLREGIDMPSGKRAWNQESLRWLKEMAKPLNEVDMDQLWRGQLWLVLQELDAIETLIHVMDSKLDAIAENNTNVCRLQTIPGVGPRLSEALVTALDNPRRFNKANQVASYLGLTPRQFESGQQHISGRISKQGNTIVRTLLVEVSWLAIRYNPWLKQIYLRVRRKTSKRNKLAIVAVAKHLLLCCWAMLRDQTDWQQEKIPINHGTTLAS